MPILLIYYLAINIILFAAMGIDKRLAIKNKRRIPEANLFIMSLLGGAVGGLIAMNIFHHKTKKIQFYIIFIVSLLLHGALIYTIATKLA